MKSEQSQKGKETLPAHKLEKSSEIAQKNSLEYIEVKSDVENHAKKLKDEPSNQKKLSKKWSKQKIGLIAGFILCCIGISIFCAIYFTMDHSRVKTQILRSGSGEVQGQQITYQQYSVQLTYKDNTQQEMTLFAIQQKDVPTGRFLQDSTQEYLDINCYFANTQNNETFRFCDHQTQTDTFLNGSDLINQIKNSDSSENLRLVQEQDSQQDLTLNKETGDLSVVNSSVNSFISQLQDEGINLQFNLQQSIEIQNHKQTDYGSNGAVESHKIENLNNPDTPTNDANPVTESTPHNRRILRWKWKKIFKRVVNIVKKIVPIAGAVVGAVIGGLAAGPLGAVKGALTGYSVGKAIANDCLPTSSSGNVKLTCDFKALSKDAVKQAASYVGGKALGSLNDTFKVTAKLFS